VPPRAVRVCSGMMFSARERKHAQRVAGRGSSMIGRAGFRGGGAVFTSGPTTTPLARSPGRGTRWPVVVVEVGPVGQRDRSRCGSERISRRIGVAQDRIEHRNEDKRANHKDDASPERIRGAPGLDVRARHRVRDWMFRTCALPVRDLFSPRRHVARGTCVEPVARAVKSGRPNRHSPH
jgi:hypothetical protein